MLDLLVLGLLQGIFEWLPISSEGIVALTSSTFFPGLNAVDAALFLHSGTMLAVLIYFREDFLALAKLKDITLLKFLVISTIVSLAIGFPLYKLFREVAVGSFLLLLTGFGLLITSFVNSNKSPDNMQTKSNTSPKIKNLKNSFLLEPYSPKLAIVVGFIQGLSVIPGLSRSGSTIFGLSFSGFSPAQILRLSYLMSLPVVLASTVYVSISSPDIFSAWPALITSFLAGFFSLSFLMSISKKIDFSIFALIFAFLCFVGAGISFLV